MNKNVRLEIKEKIKQVLISTLNVNSAVLAASESNTPLLGRGIGLDSIETLTLVAEIEREFDMQIADEDLTASLFKSLATLAEYVLRQLAERETTQGEEHPYEDPTGNVSNRCQAERRAYRCCRWDGGDQLRGS